MQTDTKDSILTDHELLIDHLDHVDPVCGYIERCAQHPVHGTYATTHAVVELRFLFCFFFQHGSSLAQGALYY